MPKIISSIILLSIILTPCLALGQVQQVEMNPTTPKLQKGIWDWFWQKFLFVWNKIYSFLSIQVEQRKPGIEDELKKETEEMKQEIKKEAPSLWQRFLDLIR